MKLKAAVTVKYSRAFPVTIDPFSQNHRLTVNKRKRRTRWNFKKANWDKFRIITEEKFIPSKLMEMTINKMNEHITQTMLEAANLSIPRGCRHNYKPFWNDQLEKAVETRKQARATSTTTSNI